MPHRSTRQAAPPPKITPPRPAKLCPRLGVWGRLDATPGPAAWWLQAPAGFGKTLAVAGWLQARGLRPAWYRMDGGDADPATLFEYLAHAVPPAAGHAADAPGPEPLPVFSADFRLGLDAFAHRWFERWWAAWGDDAAPVLVFDDAQEAGVEGPHLEVVRCAIEQMPAGARVFVLSRQGPPAAWSRLLATERLHLVTPGELALAPEEAEALVELRHPELPCAERRQLGQQCQGWAAGLVLLMQGAAVGWSGAAPGDASASGAATGTGRLFDFLAHEVLRALPLRTLALLQAAAWLPVALADVAAELSGDEGAADLLEDLHRDGIFTLRVDRADAAYQFHPLFQACLQQPPVQGSAAAASARRRRAAQVLAERGHLEGALDVALGAADWTLAASLLRRLHGPLRVQGRHLGLLRWMAALPEAHIQADPWLLFARGDSRCLMAEPDGVPDLQAASERFAADGEHDGLALSLHALSLSLISRPDANPAVVRPYTDWLIDLESRWQGTPGARLWLLRALTTNRWFSEPADPRMDGWLVEMRALAEAAGTPEALALWLHPLFLVALTRGQHERVRAALLDLDRVEARLREANLQAFCRFLRVYALNKLGRHHEALAAAEAGVAAAQAEGALIWAYQIAMHGVEACIGAGKLAQARAQMQALQRQVPVERGFAAIFNHMLAGWVALAEGDLDAALQACHDLRRCLPGADVLLFHTLEPLCRAWVHLARGEWDDTAAALDAAEAGAARLASPAVAFDAGLARAEWHHRRGDAQAAQAALAQALALGRTQGYRTVYYARPHDLAALMQRALESGVELGYVRQFIAARQLPPPVGMSEAWPWPVRIRSLGGLAITLETDGVQAPLRLGTKTPKKLLQLLKALVALGGRQVPEVRVLDSVWPELEADQAQAALKVALSRLNALLGEPGGWVTQRAGLLGLDAERVWVDLWALEQRLDAAGPLDADPAIAARAHTLADRLYLGPFLPADLHEPWSTAARERWRHRMAGITLAHARHLEAIGQPEAALAVLLQGFERDTVIEPVALQAMRLQRALGRRLEALATAERLRQALAHDLGLRPGADVLALERALLNG